MGQKIVGARPSLPDCLQAAGLVGAWIHHMTDDHVVADAGVAQLFGIMRPDPSNGDRIERYIDAIHPADRAKFTSAVYAASKIGGPFTSHYRIRTSNGVRWVHDYGSFTLDEFGNPARGQGIIVDVTNTTRELGVVEEIAAQAPLDALLQAQVEALADHVIDASEIARALPSPRLQRLTNPLLWEVGRLLTWATASRQ